MGVSNLRGERTTAAFGVPSALRPLVWGGHTANNNNNSMGSSDADARADAMDVVPDGADEAMDGDQHEGPDAVMAPAYADEDQHGDRYVLDHNDIENDRRAFDRPNQVRIPSASPSASPSPSSSAAGPMGFPGADDKPAGSRLSAPLNHHTPVTRFLSTQFLSKQTLGFIPKFSARPSPLSYVPDAPDNNSSSSNNEALTSPMGGGFRLPSLSSTPPLSPQKWTGGDDRFPPFLGPPQRVSSCGSLTDKFATMSTAGALSSSPRMGMGTGTRTGTRTGTPIPSLKEALERGAGGIRSDSGASTASSAGGSPPSTGMLTMQDICRPMAYQRSASCPSDPTVSSALLSAASEASARFPFAFAFASSAAERFADDAGGDALPSPSSSFASSPRSAAAHPPPFEDESEEGEAAVAVARSVGQRSPPPQAEYRSLSLLDITQSRLERSSSVDGAAGRGLPRPPAESIDLYQWLDRKSLHSLAESAHAVQLLEQRGRPVVSGGPAISSAPGFGLPLAAADGSSSAEQHEARREKKLCAFSQCASNAVTRGLCISHGGGRRCQRKGCTRGAQSKGLCVAHGGGRICRAKGCSNIQRSMGLCIRHGGGRRCCVPGCQKGVVRQDLCTAHGGKRKCRVEDCNKHVKKKGLCRAHANSLYQASGGGGSPA